MPGTKSACLTLGKLSPLLCQASMRSEEHTSELQSHLNLVCRLLLEKKKNSEPDPAVALHARQLRQMLVRIIVKRQDAKHTYEDRTTKSAPLCHACHGRLPRRSH